MSAIFTKQSQAPGIVTGFYRMFFSVILLLPLLVREVKRQNIPTKRTVVFALLAGLCFAGDLSFWNTSLEITSATNATFLTNTAVIWVTLFSVLLFGERFKFLYWFGLVLCFGGSAVLLGSDLSISSQQALGSVLSLFSGMFYAAFFLTSQQARRNSNAFVCWWIAAFASSVGLLFVALLCGFPLVGFSTHTWLNMFGLALVSQVAGFLSISYAIGQIRASVVAPTLMLQPLITCIIAIPLLGEAIVGMQILGGLLILAGVWFVNRQKA